MILFSTLQANNGVKVLLLKWWSTLCYRRNCGLLFLFPRLRFSSYRVSAFFLLLLFFFGNFHDVFKTEFVSKNDCRGEAK